MAQIFTNPSAVIPAQAGIQGDTHRRKLPWIPAFARMTTDGVEDLMVSLSNHKGRSHGRTTP